MRRLLVSLSLCVLPAGLVQAAVQWKLLHSDERGLLVELSISEERIVRDEEFVSVQIPGTTLGGEPGLPELPAAARWIALPPAGEVRLRVESTQLEPLQSGRIRPVPTPRLGPGEDFESPRLIETREIGELYAQGRSTAGDLIQLGDVVWSARQRMVPLRVAPILFDPASSAISILRRARVRIEFTGGDAFGSAIGSTPGGGDGTLLNPELARRWRGLPPQLEQRVERWRTRPAWDAQKRQDGVQPFVAADLESDEVRLRVTATGLWQLRLSDLIDDANVDFPTDVPRSHLRLYAKRASLPTDAHYPIPNTIDIPLHLVGNPDPAQPISASDVLIFHGQAPRDLTARTVDGADWPLPMEERVDNYNSGTVYCLALMDPGSGSWKRMAESSLGPAVATPQPFFRVTDRFEEDGGYQDNPADRFEPRYQWNDERINMFDARVRLHTPRPAVSMTVRFALTRTLRTGQARPIAVNLRQLSSGGATLVDIPLAVIDVDVPAYARLVAHSYDVQADQFTPGFVDLHLQRGDGPGLMRTYLGWIELSYDALYVTSDNGFQFDSAVTGVDSDVEVTGYTTDQLLLFETTDPYNPVFHALSAANVPSTGSSQFKLSLHVPQQAGQRRSFAAQTLARIPRLRSNNYDVDKTPDLLAATGPAQVVVIGPADFASAATPWLDYRRSRDRNGWAFAYVDVQQIYDEFSGGMKDPGAIKEFIEYYYLMHDLRAVMLAGDGNENAREVGTSPARDVVPPSVHSGGFDTTELLASDKWYAIFDHDGDGNDILANYPSRLNKGPDVLIGRLPANSASELTLLVNKIIAYENVAAGDQWRRRALYVADDAYSSGFLGTEGGRCYSYTGQEDEFEASQLRAANAVDASVDGAIDGVLWRVADIANDIRVPAPDLGQGCYDMDETRQLARTALAPAFYGLLSQGWLIVSYQGHANWNVLAHEELLVSFFLNGALQNASRPFVFYGMGCHVSDFLRAREGVDGRTIAEQFVMLNNNRGAIASYGSSGYEFLSPNAAMMETLTAQMFTAARDTSTVLDDDQFDSNWILAEVTAAAERDIVVTHPSDTYREMMAQYNLLGDPLLRLDAAPPRFSLRDGGSTIDEGGELTAPGSARSLPLGIDYVDETGLGAVRVLDVAADANLADGISAVEILRDHSPLVTLDDPTDPRWRALSIDLPIVAQDYQLVIEATDAAVPSARPTRKVYRVPMPLAVFLDGEEVQEGSTLVEVGGGGALRVEFTSPIELVAQEIEVAMIGATLVGEALNSSDQRNWVYTASVSGLETEQQLDLTLAGVTTSLDFAPAGAALGFSITRHLPYPNPSTGPIDIVGEASGGVSELRLLVYDLSGRPVYEQREAFASAPAQFRISWDGRDLEGDALANGVYLYRLEARGSAGSARSDMGRLVFMR